MNYPPLTRFSLATVAECAPARRGSKSCRRFKVYEQRQQVTAVQAALDDAIITVLLV
jgi:hypothetical protein